jgi:hypothetical protein
MSRSIHLVRPALASAALMSLLLLSGCDTTPTKPVSPPDLRLLEASPLVIPDDCEVSGGSVAVSFTVTTSGEPAEIAATAPPCVRQALVAWVQSFRYVPPAAPTPTAIEWLIVSAKRGG